MFNGILDYFRYPEGMLDFGLTGDLLSSTGFFSLGSDNLCFGRNVFGRTAAKPTDQLLDVSGYLCSDNGRCLLPFDIDEVIDNIRFEQYVDLRPPNWKRRVVRDIYYTARPVLSVDIRKHLQRFVLKRNGEVFPRFPIDTTADNIIQKLTATAMQLRKIDRLPFIWFWPDGHSSCAIMTHDVETSAGRTFCSTLMNIDDEFGIKSSFQVVPEERYAVSASFLDTLRERGFEINVHDLNHDGCLFRNYDTFLQRVRHINAYAKQFGARGYRSAVLYRNIAWYNAFSFSYDMSVPNVARFDPQPGGCCTVMPFFVGDILELPVTMTQDYTLFNILNTYSLDLWKEQMRAVRQKNGLISFIVHPDYLDKPEARQCYEALLQYLVSLRSDNIWISLPKEVDEWWRQRSNMRLRQTASGWRIEGVGSDRACVAYATMASDGLRYSFA